MGGRKDGSLLTEKLAGSLILAEMFVGVVEGVSGVSSESTIDFTDFLPHRIFCFVGRSSLYVEPLQKP